MLFCTVTRQVRVSECTNTYTHIHITAVLQDRALTLSPNFHTLTPKKRSSHAQHRSFKRKWGKKDRKERNTNRRWKYLLSNWQIFVLLNRQKKLKVSDCNVPGISSSFHFVLVQSLCAATCLNTIFSHHIHGIKSQTQINAHHLLKAHFNIIW